MRSSHRRATALVVLLLLVCLSAAAALAFSAAPAHAYVTFVHDTATSCASCHPGGNVMTPPTNANCTACHTGFKTDPAQTDQTCWTCHAPGQDTKTFSSSAEACTQGCHLFDAAASTSTPTYDIDFTHGQAPHLGASGFGKTCLDCHSTSVSAIDPGASPHHSGTTLAAPTCQECHNGTLASAQPASHVGLDCSSCHNGMDIPSTPTVCYTCHAQEKFGTGNCATCHASLIHNAAPDVGTCTTCHAGYKQHAGSVACTKCHTNPVKFHHGTGQLVAKKCGACHSKSHAGRRIAVSRCASCHKGKTPAGKPAVQHSSTISKKYVCSTCHAKSLHAKAYGAKLTCRSCHAGKYHARQPRPGNSVCLRCHYRARYHAVGYACFVCHRRAIHSTRPSA